MYVPESRVLRYIIWLAAVGIILRRSRKRTLALIATLERTLATCRTCGQSMSASALNMTLYVSVLEMDMCHLLGRLWTVQDLWERKLICRHLALAIVEGIEDLAELNGQCINQQSEDSILRKEQKRVSRLLNELKRKHDRKLRELRVTATAHREKDAIVLVRVIHDMDGHEIEELGWDVFHCLTQVKIAASAMMDNGCKKCKEVIPEKT